MPSFVRNHRNYKISRKKREVRILKNKKIFVMDASSIDAFKMQMKIKGNKNLCINFVSHIQCDLVVIMQFHLLVCPIYSVPALDCNLSISRAEASIRAHRISVVHICKEKCSIARSNDQVAMNCIVLLGAVL